MEPKPNSLPRITLMAVTEVEIIQVNDAGLIEGWFKYSKTEGSGRSGLFDSPVAFMGKFVFRDGSSVPERIAMVIRLEAECLKGWHNPDYARLSANSVFWRTFPASRGTPTPNSECLTCRLALHGIPKEWPWFTYEELAIIPQEAIIWG